MSDNGMIPMQGAGDGRAQRGGARSDGSRAQWRARNMRRLLAILAIASCISILVNLVVFLQDTALWQLLATTGVIALALVLIPVAFYCIRRQKLDVAGYLILWGVVSVLATCQLLLAGATLILATAGLFLILSAGYISFPNRRWVWLVGAGLFPVYALLVDYFEPLPRFVIANSSQIYVFVPLISLFLVAAGLWIAIRAFRVGTIRTRLLIAFVIAVLVPVIILGVGMVVLGMRNEQQQVAEQVESVAILKESEINTWLSNLNLDMQLALSGDLVAQRAISLLQDAADPSTTNLADTMLRARFEQVIRQTGRFEEIFLLNQDGTVIFSTDPTQEGQARGNQRYFREGLNGFFVQRPYYSTSEQEASQFVAQPIKNARGEVQGVLVGRASLTALNDIMAERAGLGETGETYLVSSNTLLTPNQSGQQGLYVDSPGISRALAQGASGSGRYVNYRGEVVVGAYRWLPELEVALLAEQQEAEALDEVYAMLLALGGVAVVAVIIAVVISLFLTRSIATPLSELVTTATQISAGNLDLDARVEREDEIGSLSRAFNAMTSQLRDLIGGLERRVADRTQELRQRSVYLEAAAKVGRAAASILDADELMQTVVRQISQEFDLYYVGLFLVDAAGQWAVLRANAGQSEGPLPALGQRLAVADSSMVGWSIVNAEPRIALEAETDEVRQPRPELPRTRSEAALPLRARGQVIGAISVQHTQPDAFDQDILVVLQTMADQVAVALENARLFAEREEALQTAQRAYGELSREAWVEILQSRSTLGYRSDERGVEAAGDVWRPEMEQALHSGQTVRGNGAHGGEVRPLAVPIKIRDQVVGVLDTYKPAGSGDWTEEEVALVEAIAAQLDAALESARLYQDTQHRAAREQAIRHVTDEMRRAVDIEAILQTTLAEMSRALGAPRVYVRLGTDLGSGPDRAQDATGEG